MVPLSLLLLYYHATIAAQALAIISCCRTWGSSAARVASRRTLLFYDGVLRGRPPEGVPVLPSTLFLLWLHAPHHFSPLGSQLLLVRVSLATL